MATFKPCKDTAKDVVCGCPPVDFDQRHDSPYNAAVLQCRERCAAEIRDKQAATIECFASQAVEAEEVRR